MWLPGRTFWGCDTFSETWISAESHGKTQEKGEFQSWGRNPFRMPEPNKKANVLNKVSKRGNEKAVRLEKSPGTRLYRVMVRVLDFAASMMKSHWQVECRKLNDLSNVLQYHSTWNRFFVLTDGMKWGVGEKEKSKVNSTMFIWEIYWSWVSYTQMENTIRNTVLVKEIRT